MNVLRSDVKIISKELNKARKENKNLREENKNLREENKNVREENKKLKKENKQLCDDIEEKKEAHIQPMETRRVEGEEHKSGDSAYSLDIASIEDRGSESSEEEGSPAMVADEDIRPNSIPRTTNDARMVVSKPIKEGSKTAENIKKVLLIGGGVILTGAAIASFGATSIPVTGIVITRTILTGGAIFLAAKAAFQKD